MLALLSLLLSTAAAACPASTADLRAAIDAGVAAYGEWAWDRFGLARADVAGMIGCLSEPLAPEDARRIHLFAALQAGVDKDEARATGAFRALLAVDPVWALPAELAAPGSLLQRAFDAARVEVEVETLRLPKGDWLVDGASGVRALPLSRPAVLQRRTPESLDTWLVAGEPLPDSLSEALSRPAPKPRKAAETSAEAPGSGRRPLVLGAASGGALALSALSFGLAWRAWDAYPDARTAEEAASLNRANHVFYAGGVAVGAVGLGLGVGAALDGWR